MNIGNLPLDLGDGENRFQFMIRKKIKNFSRKSTIVSS